MSNLRRVLTLFVASCLSLSFVACTPKDKIGTQQSSEQTPVSQSTTSDIPEETDRYKPFDLGGRKITIAANYDVVPANSEHVYNPDKDNPTVEKTIARMKRIEEKYNCKIQYINVPYDQRIEKITSSVMSGEPIADIFGLDIKQILPLVINDMIIPYDDFLPANADVLTDKKVMISAGELFGKTYALDFAGVQVNGSLMGVNLDLINGLGLDANPVELYEKGEWTWEKFMEIAKAATKDTDGDGKIDQFGVSGPPQELLNMFVGSNGGAYFDEIGKKQAFDSPNTMAALDFFNNIYNVDKVGAIIDTYGNWDSNLHYYKEGKSAMFFAAQWSLPDGENKPPFKYSVIPAPQGPSYNGTNNYIKQIAGWTILKNVKDPQYVYQVFEELNTPDDFAEQEETNREWIESKFYYPEDAQRLFSISATGGKPDAAFGIEGYPIEEIVKGIVEGGKTPAQAVEENKQIAQGKIDSIFK